LPHTSSNLPESGAGRTNGILFGLAPSGVYPAAAVTNGAVRSYHTISPLPSPDFPLSTIFLTAIAWPTPWTSKRQNGESSKSVQRAEVGG